MSALKYTSVFSLCSTCYIMFVVVFRSVQFNFFSAHTPWPVVDAPMLFNFDLRLFVALPILAIAFAFHMNIAPVQMELK